MKTKMTAVLAASLLTAGAVAQAAPKYDPKTDPNGNMIGLTTEIGQIAYDFIDLWFNKHKTKEAWEKYVSKTDYVNHAVYSATKATLKNSFEKELEDEGRAAGPTTKFDFKQIIAQGNLVFLHIAATQGAGGPGVGEATGLPTAMQGREGGGAPPGGGAPGGAPGAGGPPGGGPRGGGMPMNDGIRGDHKGPDEMLMILRIHKGKVVDHWDVHVPTSSDSVVFEELNRKLQ